MSELEIHNSWDRNLYPFIIVKRKKDIIINEKKTYYYWKLKYYFDDYEKAILKWMDLIINNLSTNLRKISNYEIWEIKSNNSMLPHSYKKYKGIRLWQPETKDLIHGHTRYDIVFGIIKHTNYFDESEKKKGHTNITIDGLLRSDGVESKFTKEKIIIFTEIMELYINNFKKTLQDLHKSILKKNLVKPNSSKKNTLDIWNHKEHDITLLYLKKN